MATGISMSSVNKIKELAENGEYGLALDILENQDLSRSLSPQFIRVCGEVYYENHKYHEARAALVRAHSMAPAGNKIIFSLIQLYLTMGLRTLADKYYEIYKFNLDGREDAGKLRLEYLFAKADRKPVSELHAILVSANDKEKAERWEYEHLLILAVLKEQEKLKYEGEVFKATYKKSVYIDGVNALLAGTADPDKELYCFPETEAADDADCDADTRKMEEKALEADDYRLNPTAPTITLMVENDEPVSSAMKLKQTFARNKAKREEKKEKKKLARAEAEGNVENIENENADPVSGKHQKKGLFKRRMSKQEEDEIIEALAGIKESDDDNTTLLNKIMDEEEAQTDHSETDEKTDEAAEETKTTATSEVKEVQKENETVEHDVVLQEMKQEKTDAASQDMKNDEADAGEPEEIHESSGTSGVEEVPEKTETLKTGDTPVAPAASMHKSMVLESVRIKPDISDIKITTMSGSDDTADDFDPMFDEDDLDEQINSIIESEINGDRDSLAYNDVVREVEQQEAEKKRRHEERVSSDTGLDKDKDSMISNMELTENSMNYSMNVLGEASDDKDASEIPESRMTDENKTSTDEAVTENIIADNSDKEAEEFDFISVDEDEDVSFAENADEEDLVTIDHSQMPESVEEIKIEDLAETQDVKIVDLMDTLTDVNEVSVDIAGTVSESQADDEPETETETAVEPEHEHSGQSEIEDKAEAEAEIEAESDKQIEAEEKVETVDELKSAEKSPEPEETETEIEEQPEPEEAETETEEQQKPEEVETETVESSELEEVETETEEQPEPEEAEIEAEEQPRPEEAEELSELEEITTPDELDQMLREIEMISRENEKIVKGYEDTVRAEEAQPVEEEEPEPVKYGFQSDKLVGDEGYEFPVFRSELFPEYNSDNGDGGNRIFNPDDIKLENQEKIDEHLAEEEALLKETDELLARLGIELGTKYYSGTDYFTKEQFEEDHEAVKRMDASINQKQDDQTKEDNSRFKLR